MAKVLHFAENYPAGASPDQIYNGLDVTTTAEIWEALRHWREDPITQMHYAYTKGMRGPAMEMTFRGILVDQEERMWLDHKFHEDEARLIEYFEVISETISGLRCNPRSTKQCQKLLYESMRLPPQYKYDKKERVEKLTTSIEALERLKEIGPDAYLICNFILASRDAREKIKITSKSIDEDGRMRFSFNVAGASTGRWSSSENPMWTGTNGQNITDEMRRMFVADPGKKLGNVDLSQADARNIAYLSGDEGYIAACEGPDLHTHVAIMIWPTAPWVLGPDHRYDYKACRKLAEQKFWRHFDRRDLAKRGGHAKNYMILANTMSQRLKIPYQLCVDFGFSYYQAFPGIPALHNEIQVYLIEDAARHGGPQGIFTPTGRRRYSFGLPYESDTQRAIVAHMGQSMTGDIMNVGLFRLWHYPKIELLAQIHDAALFQYDPADENEVLSEVLRLMKTPVPVGPRTLLLPSDVTCGWNWAHYLSEADAAFEAEKSGLPVRPNLSGLKKWTPDGDSRTAPATTEKSLLDYVLR
jgi:DNA polymerase I